MMLMLAALLAAHAVAQPALREGSVRQADGATIAYYVREGSGPALVLIPGSWGDYRVYDRMLAALDPSLRVVIVELRGHGKSRPAASRPTMQSLAADVLSVVDALPLRRFYVGGHSIGGMLAIEIAGQRPSQVAGVISMEGWTHAAVATEAFGNAPASTMTPEEEERNKEQRERVLSTLSAEERAAFAAVWRTWDGLPVLQRTPSAVLELWGDRARARPSRAQMRIPERGNIRLVWVAGSSHSLLVQRPAEVARHTNEFVRVTEAVARRMFDGDAVPDFSRLPRLHPETIPVYRGVGSVTGFNMHPYLTWYQGRFWAMWSSNRIRDLQAGQYVRYATSADGVRWGESAMLTPSEEKENFRYFARGWWLRDGALIGLAARDEAVRPLFGPGLELRGYRWGDTGFAPPVVVARDTINNFAPEPLAGGPWLMARRDHKMRSSIQIGGDPLTAWETIPLPAAEDGTTLDEPVVWRLPDGGLSAAFRDGGKSRRLYRSFSRDGGRTWTAPVRTNFPDAMAKFHVLRLSTGVYAMVSNPNPSGVRIPQCLSFSRDGVVFGSMHILRDAPTIYRYDGKDPGYAGYHYAQLLEHGGFLYVIYSENMEDILLHRIPLSSLPRL